ncbi:MAG: capsular biosynthesis protein [Solirubrobacterales bacterium]|nr:capsular biosynthesis protein [Solirubrobacterales bacterium]
MTSDSFLSVVWRRKWIVLATMILLAAATYAYASTQDKVYASSATLLIAQPSDAQSFDAVQTSQVAARTYGDVLTSPNIAEQASKALGGQPSGPTLESAVSAEPVPETQLLRLTAEAGDPNEAKRIADTYASVFTAYVRRTLTPVTKVTITLADAASVPDAASRPKPKLYAALALALGLALGLALAALRERFDHRIRTVEDLEGLIDAPLLARIPRRGRGEVGSAAFTEAFRVLRTNLQFAFPEGALHTVAVTSYAPVEGKSTTVSQLARVSASAGNEVLVVEADLKRPSQQAFFRPDATGRLSPGLTTFIVGGAPLEACVHPTGISSVHLLPAGPQVPSLSGLLESARGREVLDDLAGAADLVLFDCPPLSVGADASTVAGRVDGVVLVIDMEQATRDSVREALRQLQAVRARILGVVANRDPDVDDRVYGYGDDVVASRGPAARMNL